MGLEEAIELIRTGIQGLSGSWADIGAGTGMFTRALAEILSEEQFGRIEERGNGGNGRLRPSSVAGGHSLWRRATAKGGNPPSLSYGGRSKGKIYAVDKSPHALWELKSTSNVEIIVVEADFNEPLELPPMDGIVMANALHYAEDHLIVLKNVLRCLKPGGTFILVEYETEKPRPPWVPHPVPFKRFETLCTQAHLNMPEMIGKHESQYGYEHIYAAMTTKI